MRIAASIASGDLSRLAEMAVAAQEGGADWIHLDIEDGVFVPTFTVGPRAVQGVRQVTRAPLEVHLQTVRPERWLEVVAEARPDRIIVHVEGVGDVPGTLARIRAAGIGVGLALLPDSAAGLLEPYASRVDMVTILSAGLEDGAFRAQALDTVRRVREHGVEVEVDGGIVAELVPAVREAGASAVVSGRAIFGRGVERVAEAIAALRAAAG